MLLDPQAASVCCDQRPQHNKHTLVSDIASRRHKSCFHCAAAAAAAPFLLLIKAWEITPGTKPLKFHFLNTTTEPDNWITTTRPDNSWHLGQGAIPIYDTDPGGTNSRSSKIQN